MPTSSSGPAGGLRLRALTYRARESLAVLPGLIVVGAIGLALLLVRTDRAIFGRANEGAPKALQLAPSAAQQFLSVLAGATITTAGVVFSLTVVSLQLASGQFSPRVLRTFVRDRVAQVVVGTLVATFSYCVLVLRTVRDQGEKVAPPLSMAAAVALAITAVILVLVYLDHLTRSLQVGEVLRRIGDEGSDVLAELCREARDLRAVATPDVTALGTGCDVPADRDGWVTLLSSGRVLRAMPPGTTVLLLTRPGAYVSEGQPVARLWPVPADPDATRRALGSAVHIGAARTMQEDLDFAFRQMVDIALRALSPAINDPTTAVEATLRIGSLLRRLLLADLPGQALGGPDGRVLLRPWDLDAAEYVAHAFDQVRLAGQSHPLVCMAVLRTVRMLVTACEDAGRPQQVGPLVRQARLTLESVGSDPTWTEDDKRRVREAADAGTDLAEHGATDAVPIAPR